MKNEKRLYVAYGSNLDMAQMAFRCPTAKRIGTSSIKDYELLFKGHCRGSYLTIEQAKGQEVPVGVWEVSAEDEQNLDLYEGYPTFYYKTDMELDVKDDKTGKVSRCKVFVYIMHEENGFGIPSDRYVYTCARGYLDFGFSSKYLARALRRSYEELQEPAC